MVCFIFFFFFFICSEDSQNVKGDGGGYISMMTLTSNPPGQGKSTEIIYAPRGSMLQYIVVIKNAQCIRIYIYSRHEEKIIYRPLNNPFPLM
jgi:hypothetical protein